ncbi:hypothetical protein [Pedobacter caeni]|uniref:Transglutaminase-like superfamily protein n=1 Tax=Pedobacter caeni TaxID=288992 RepID=A0A1M5ERK0_9SPHI|nr:hypothetical protein [Pedobacter caeni]SHF81632.1 hypothetical protein SAMN04488522_103753 [Pedobacter caeni]
MRSLIKNSVLLLLVFAIHTGFAQDRRINISFEFYNDTFNLELDSSFVVSPQSSVSQQYILDSYKKANTGNYRLIADTLLRYKEKHKLNDWLYYQLIRKTAQQISPKKDDYIRYTFYKWFLLVKSGYDARLTTVDNRIIMYIFNDENISEVPYIIIDKKKFMCLNYHDYAQTNFSSLPDNEMVSIAEAKNPFSYKVNRMPDFKPENYSEKKILFSYRHKSYHFNIKLNPEVENIFTNYPGVDFEYYFNIPLSKETYGSIIPTLRKNLEGMSQKKGVDYLMRFTRYAFLYENDDVNFGKEKRLSPEETLFSAYSDCDDRAALFFYLVKEIYDLPMITLLYPTHVTMAVQFEKSVGTTISYNGKEYTICEPTPQLQDLRIGQLNPKLKNVPYQIVYAYQPNPHK